MVTIECMNEGRTLARFEKLDHIPRKKELIYLPGFFERVVVSVEHWPGSDAVRVLVKIPKGENNG